MKKIFNLLFILSLVGVGCSDTKEDSEPDICCSIGPLHQYIIIRDTSAEFASFFKDSVQYDKKSPNYERELEKNIDRENIHLFSEDNKSIRLYVHIGDRNRYYSDSTKYTAVMIERALPEEKFDKKKETTYLKNRTKTYKIEALSEKTTYMGSTYFKLLEVSVNGVRQADSLTKRQEIDL